MKTSIHKFHFPQIFYSFKYIILNLSVFVVFISGCSQYQYITIKSGLTQNEKKEFYTENDTVQLKYSFAGNNCPINIEVHNKLSQPIYIDFTKSSLIIDNVQIDNPYYFSNPTEFIAPESTTTITGIPLENKFIEVSPRDSQEIVNIPTEEGYKKEIKYLYNLQNSPLYFRSYMTISTRNDFSVETNFDNPFWISGVRQTLDSPSTNDYQKPNQFILRRTTGFGKFMGWTATISLIILLGLAAP
jgi:hypothetical protein